MYKYCPYCSTKLKPSPLDEQFQKCGNCGTKIYHHTPQTAACILLNDSRKILLVKRRNDPFKNKWSLPAGFVQFGENPINAAIRELKEETGLSAKYDQVVGTYIADDHPLTFSALTVITVNNVEGNLAPSDDAGECKYFNPKSLPKMAFKTQVKAIEDFFYLP